MHTHWLLSKVLAHRECQQVSHAYIAVLHTTVDTTRQLGRALDGTYVEEIFLVAASNRTASNAGSAPSCSLAALHCMTVHTKSILLNPT